MLEYKDSGIDTKAICSVCLKIKCYFFNCFIIIYYQIRVSRILSVSYGNLW